MSSAYTPYLVYSVGCLCWRNLGLRMVVVAGGVWPYEFDRSGFLYIYVSCDFDYCITRTIYGIKSLYFVSCYCMYLYRFYVSLYYFSILHSLQFIVKLAIPCMGSMLLRSRLNVLV